MPEHLCHQRPCAAVMTAFALMDLQEHLLALSRIDTPLQHLCGASLVQLLVDDGVAFGPPLYPPAPTRSMSDGFCLLFCDLNLFCYN